ncbi:LuxR C-terminal-related transcriptional regulator [Lentzea kentuckyensis]|uniref:LuxR C-terminal-related transcriptional regulator n=1 Tax=Lentzea kentuckyensis TaxID=360086 RepID=UPI000A3CEC53|nr:LuxR C-terminal-related transcriptional regulator [Lentzea kentuckyensis]
MAVTRVTPGVVAHPAGRLSAITVPRPRTVPVGKEPTVATRRLLRLMRTGATDRAIARELDVSLRTLNRRIARLQSLLGVQSRFQLGVLAAELEWLAVGE